MQIDYYFTLQSPWAYLGHARFVALARQHGAVVRPMPTDYGQVFPVSGGLPLPKRAPQRQAYRLVELKRFSGFLGIPMNVQPTYFPVSGDAAARLVLTVLQADGVDAALDLAGRTMAAVWAQQRDIASAETLAALLDEAGLAKSRLGESGAEAVLQAYQACTQSAIDAGVFGAPTYVVEGELFWGQDRLDFLERRLKAARG